MPALILQNSACLSTAMKHGHIEGAEVVGKCNFKSRKHSQECRELDVFFRFEP